MDEIIGALIVALVRAWVFRWQLYRLFRRRRPWRVEPDVTDAAQQLSFVSRAAFERQPLLNKSEFGVLLLLEDVVHGMRAGHRVMAQTCLGEILRPAHQPFGSADRDLAYRSINSKRVDFVVVDRRGMAVLAVEYHGDGHFQGNARLRDAVKREAFRSAGVALIELPARFAREDVARQVREALAAAEPYIAT
jgi:hypothetical protein